MIDMLLGIFLNRGRKTIVFIDTYSHHAFNYALFCSLFCKIIRVKYIPILRGGNLPHRLKKNPYLTKIIFANSIINISPSKFLKIKFLKKYGYNQQQAMPEGLQELLQLFGIQKKTKKEMFQKQMICKDLIQDQNTLKKKQRKY